MFELGLFMRRTYLKRSLIEPNNVFENLTSFKIMFELGLFVRQPYLKGALIEPNHLLLSFV